MTLTEIDILLDTLIVISLFFIGTCIFCLISIMHEIKGILGIIAHVKMDQFANKNKIEGK